MKRPPLLLIMLMLSLGMNLAQTRRVNSYRERITNLKEERQLKVGAVVSPLSGDDLTGHKRQVSFGSDGRRTLIYVFTPTCGWCKRNADNIRTIANSLSSDFRFVGVSLTDKDLGQYVSDEQFRFDVLTVSGESRAAWKLGGTPQMVVVGPDGKVLKNWMGAPQDSLQTEIEDYFGFKLPGLRPVPTKSTGA